MLFLSYRTERDVSSWSSVLLRDLLLGVRAEGPEGVVQLTEVPKVEGESSINNRRGKLFFFYEWQLRASWLGTTGGGVKFRGTVDVSNLSDENDMEDLDISVSLCKDQPDTPLLGLMKTRGVQEVRRALGEFVRQLKSEFSQGMILAKADGQPQLPEPQTQKNQIQTCKAQVYVLTSRHWADTGVKVTSDLFELSHRKALPPGVFLAPPPPSQVFLSQPAPLI